MMPAYRQSVAIPTQLRVGLWPAHGPHKCGPYGNEWRAKRPTLLRYFFTQPNWLAMVVQSLSAT